MPSRPFPTRPGLILALLLVAVAVPACGPGRKKVYPVNGELYVDGKPAPNAFIYLHPVDGSDPDAVRPWGQADESGAFKLSSYESGDGAPAGDYIVCFEWRETSGIFQQNYGGQDRLKGMYYEKDKSDFRVTIGKGPTLLPRYDLSSTKPGSAGKSGGKTASDK